MPSPGLSGGIAGRGIIVFFHEKERRAGLFWLARVGAFFIFIFFQNRFLQKYIFGFTGLYLYRPTGGRQGAYRPSAGRPAPLPGGRGLYVIKICVSSHGDPYRPARGLPPGRGTASPPI